MRSISEILQGGGGHLKSKVELNKHGDREIQREGDQYEEEAGRGVEQRRNLVRVNCHYR